MRSDFLNDNSGVSNVNSKFETIAAARTLEADDSGKVFGVNQASAYTITLPLAATAGPGWHCTFIVVTAASYKVTIANNTDEDTICGMTTGADGGAGSSVETVSVDEVAFISGAVVGDKVDLFCDGASYYAYGLGNDVAHITIS